MAGLVPKWGAVSPYSSGPMSGAAPEIFVIEARNEDSSVDRGTLGRHQKRLVWDRRGGKIGKTDNPVDADPVGFEPGIQGELLYGVGV